MKRSLRKRSGSLVFPMLFITTLAFAYAMLPAVFMADEQSPAPPDSTLTTQTQSSDSLYQKLVASISALFNQQRFEECLVQLKKAQALKPGVSSIQERIIRVEGLIAQQKKTMAEYNRMIIMADDYFVKKDYLNAKASYQLALDTKPEDAYAREKMNQTMELLRSGKAQNILYDVTLASADKLFAAGDYDKAKSQYENASRILPGEAYPKEKINAIIKILVDRQVREELYQQAITVADKFYASKSFQRSLLEYQKALQQKPAESYPQKRIEELTKILADLAVLEAAYKDAITRADKLFSESRYPDSRSAYEEALALKTKEPYPAGKISEIDDILARIARNDADFERFVTLADSFYMDRNFIRARQNYQLSLQIKPNESYPKAMLEKTEAGVGEQYSNEIAMEEAYKSAIVNADRLFAQQSLPEAKGEYENALSVKPDESYPKQRISEIGTLLEEALARKQELDARYMRVVENADRMFTENMYSQAKEQYQAALVMKPSEAYPAGKIAELDGILVNLEQQRAKDARYKSVLSEANKLFTSRSYEPAKLEYVKALEIKPSEPLPAERIHAIDSILMAMANNEALDQQYADHISVADERLGQLEYQAAKISYQEALVLKPKENYPAGKIREIEAILAEHSRVATLDLQYSQAIIRGDSLITAGLLIPARGEFETASSLKPVEAYPKEKLAEIKTALQTIASQQALEALYLQEVASADKLFAGKTWDPAIAAYKRALEAKPAEGYPVQKIREIDSIKQEIEHMLALDQEYQKTISIGERHLAGREYDSARIEFISAQTLKPSETLPGSRLAMIDSILTALENQRRLDEKYAALVASSDKLFSDKEYTAAIGGFNQALDLKPNERYPASKVAEIEGILAEISRIAALDARYSQAVASGDLLFTENRYEEAREAYQGASEIKSAESYPRERIKEINQILAEIQGRRQTFDKLVISGDQFFMVKEYFKAREKFTQALELFPEEEHPNQQLRIANVKIDSIYRANKADYDKAVGEGDGFFNSYEYDKAIDAYTRASTFLTNEEYPRQMIVKIRKTIVENAIADVVSSPVIIKAGEERKFSFDPVNIASRRNNFIYLKVKNLSGNNFNILMRYGKGDLTSGGLAIRNITTDGEVNERLISVKDQDPWYREDNNWISLYPQGGDIEVSFIQVSRAIK